MLSVDVKANKNNKRRSGSLSHNFLLEVPSKLEIQCKKGVHFSFDFGWYSIHLDIVC